VLRRDDRSRTALAGFLLGAAGMLAVIRSTQAILPRLSEDFGGTATAIYSARTTWPALPADTGPASRGTRGRGPASWPSPWPAWSRPSCC
jgi:hypothetical protein